MLALQAKLHYQLSKAKHRLLCKQSCAFLRNSVFCTISLAKLSTACFASKAALKLITYRTSPWKRIFRWPCPTFAMLALQAKLHYQLSKAKHRLLCKQSCAICAQKDVTHVSCKYLSLGCWLSFLNGIRCNSLQKNKMAVISGPTGPYLPYGPVFALRPKSPILPAFSLRKMS